MFMLLSDNMDISLKEVRTKKDLKQFILFPNSLYADNPYYVPPLIKDEFYTLSKSENPAFEYCEAKYWLAYKNNRIVGRIAGVINKTFITKWGKRYARFGWLDFIDDAEVSKALLKTVEAWALEHNMEAVHGPLGFTDFDPEGMLVDGFSSPGTMTTIYNDPYYPQHLEKLHYVKDADWVEFELPIPEVSESVRKIAQWVAEKYNLYVLQAKSAKELRPYAHQIFNLINEAYADLYGVVPLTSNQVEAYTNQYFSFIHPDYVTVILRNNTVMAFAITMPSLTKALQKAKGKLFPFGFFHLYKALHKNDLADLYLIAVHPSLQGKGVTSLIIKDLCEKLKRNHITRAITHPMLEQNGKMLSLWNGYEKKLIKRRRCYIKFLQS